MLPVMTDTDRAILDFERTHSVWLHRGSKEDQIRARFAMSPTRYHQRLVQLLDHPGAEAYDAFTVRRLRTLASRRRNA